MYIYRPYRIIISVNNARTQAFLSVWKFLMVSLGLGTWDFPHTSQIYTIQPVDRSDQYIHLKFFSRGNPVEKSSLSRKEKADYNSKGAEPCS